MRAALHQTPVGFTFPLLRVGSSSSVDSVLGRPAVDTKRPPVRRYRPRDLARNPSAKRYRLMKHSHGSSLTASRSMRVPFGALADAQDAAAFCPRTSEGPVTSWVPEALPLGSSPTAHIPQEPLGSPPS